MTFIKTSDREGCFRPEAVTRFTVHSTIENLRGGGQHHITFMKMFSATSQIAECLWTGTEALTYEIVGGALARAELSREAVVSFDSLIKCELEKTLVPALSIAS